ncbi:hypothetical protein BDU57DRAFT_81850 [Ampelomyces quisqualis]|uniref:Secreted protein n=1 Tax=Ampelomyces quisqualis TaxID=50730 RepID=A0A6A5QBG8_AMPQU|nr:hypothetical protein BDU57DRAFT_81850 [Ampelomyces quisqualis]
MHKSNLISIVILFKLEAALGIAATQDFKAYSSILAFNARRRISLINLAVRRLISIRIVNHAALLVLHSCPPIPRGEALALNLRRILLRWLWLWRLLQWFPWIV